MTAEDMLAEAKAEFEHDMADVLIYASKLGLALQGEGSPFLALDKLKQSVDDAVVSTTSFITLQHVVKSESETK